MSVFFMRGSPVYHTDTNLCENTFHAALPIYVAYRLAGTKIDPSRPATSEYPAMGVDVKAFELERAVMEGRIRYRLIRFTQLLNAQEGTKESSGRLSFCSPVQFMKA